MVVLAISVTMPWWFWTLSVCAGARGSQRTRCHPPSFLRYDLSLAWNPPASLRCLAKQAARCYLSLVAAPRGQICSMAPGSGDQVMSSCSHSRPFTNWARAQPPVLHLKHCSPTWDVFHSRLSIQILCPSKLLPTLSSSPKFNPAQAPFLLLVSFIPFTILGDSTVYPNSKSLLERE